MNDEPEPKFCSLCGRKLRDRRSNVTDYVFLSCPRYTSFHTWLLGQQGHTDILTHRRWPARFDPETGAPNQ